MKKTNKNKLLAYSSSALYYLALHSAAEGQIVYVDNPDTLININDESYTITDPDMGTDAFTISKTSILNSGTGPEGYPYYYKLNNLVVDPQSVSIAGYYISVLIFKGMPYVINAGDEIGPDLNWLPGDSSTTPMYLAWYRKLVATGTYNDGHLGSWRMGVNNKYMGFRFESAGAYHYGWLRMNVINVSNDHSALLKDFAFQLTPDTPIAAGDVGTPDTTISISNNPGLIENVIITSDASTVYVDLNQLNGKECRIQLFDILGNELYNEVSSGPSKQIDISLLAAGNYICRVTVGEESISKKLFLHK